MTQGKEIYWKMAIIFAVAMAAYANTLGNGFVYDDHLQILDNPWLRSPRELGKIFSSDVWGFTAYSASDYYRPLMHTLNLLVYTLFGPSRFFFHLSSVILHAGCSVLLFAVARQLVVKQPPDETTPLEKKLPFVAALLFAVYPANNESVAWLGSLSDLLYVFFSLLALWTYQLKDDFSRTKRLLFYGSSLLFFLAATLSKETAFLFPLVLFCSDWVRGGLAAEKWHRLLVQRYLGFVVILFISLVIRFAALGTLRPVANTVNFEASGILQALTWYLGRLLWPFTHNFYPELSGTHSNVWLVCGVVSLLLTATLISLQGVLRRNRLLWFSLLILVLPLLPALANYAIGKPVAERYLYFPTLGFSLLLAWVLLTLCQPDKLRILVVSALVLIFASSTFARNADFRNDLTIWADTIEQSPQSSKARGWYATALLAAGRLEEGIEQTRIAIDLGLNNANNLLDLAAALGRLGRSADIVWYLNRVLEKNPKNAQAFFEVARSYSELGEGDEAVRLFEQAKRLRPNDHLTLIFLARAYAKRGDYALAEQLYSTAIQLDPQSYPQLKSELDLIKAEVREK